jgi:transcriptional regulator with XRE-family HTH domain
MAKRNESNTLIAAVRKLRLALGDTQQAFADRLGLAIATVVRYEHNRTPRGKALARLQQVAQDNGFSEYAALFGQALNEEFATPQITNRKLCVQPKNQEEEELVDALLYALRIDAFDPHSERAKPIRRALKPIVEERRRMTDEIEAVEAQQKAIAKLIEKGRTPQEVMDIFKTSADVIAAGFFEYCSPMILEKRMREVVDLLLKEGWSIKRMAKEFGNGDTFEFRQCAYELGAHRAIDDYEQEVAADEPAND